MTQIANVPGNSSVLAAAKGVVLEAVHASPAAGFGSYEIIEHTLPDLSKVRTLYAHLKNVNVSIGQEVTIGTQIGTMDLSGAPAATHLHFDVG